MWLATLQVGHSPHGGGGAVGEDAQPRQFWGLPSSSVGLSLSRLLTEAGHSALAVWHE